MDKIAADVSGRTDGGGTMKIITIEEHVLNPAVAQASAAALHQLSPYWGAAFSPDSGLPYTPFPGLMREGSRLFQAEPETPPSGLALIA